MTISRVLITGGAGFVGTNIANKLINDGHEVIIIDDLSSSHKESVNYKAIFVEGSIVDEKALAKCFNYKPDYVIHLAALFANQNSVDNPSNDLNINGLGILKILEWSKNMGVKKVVYTSSSCVYGNKAVMQESDLDFHPETPYAITKLLGERYAKFWSTHHNLDIAIVRLFNVYGPGDFPGVYRSVVPNFIKLALNGDPLIITGSGNETRDFCYIDDTVNGICLSLFNQTKPCDIFNIATGSTSSIIEIANFINSYCNNSSKIQFMDRRKWDGVVSRQADINKISSVLGYKSEIKIIDGLRKTCDWLISLES
jgi:UDP-glucose 4-epimerase